MAKIRRPPPSSPEMWSNPGQETHHHPLLKGHPELLVPLRSTPTTPAGQGEGSVSTPGRGLHHLSFPTGHRGTPNPARSTPTGRGQARASSFDMRNPRASPVLGGRLDRTTIYDTASFSPDPYMTNLFDTVAPLPMSPSLALQIRDELFRSEAQYLGLDTLSRAPHMTSNSLVSEDNNPLGSSDARHPSTDSQSLPFTPTQLWTPKHLIGLSGGVTEFPSGPLKPPITNSVRAPGYSEYLIPEIPLISRTGPGAWAIEGAGMAPSRPRYPPSSQYTPQEQRKSMTSAPPIPLLMM
jgi:hypothetical protein